MIAGNDLNEETTPIEASLKWTIGKRRQEKFDFIGGDVIKKQIQDGIKRRRVGILSDGAPARAGAVIALPDGTEVRIPAERFQFCSCCSSVRCENPNLL